MQEVKLLRSGKYEFHITGVVSRKDGNPLKTKDGVHYQKLKVTVIDREGYSHFVYDPLFGNNSEKLKQIFGSVRDGFLAKELDKVDEAILTESGLDLRALIGLGGYCIVGVQKGSDGYPPENNIECYLREGSQYLSEASYPILGKNLAKMQQFVTSEASVVVHKNDNLPF